MTKQQPTTEPTIPPDLWAEIVRFVEQHGAGDVTLHVADHKVVKLTVRHVVRPEKKAS